MPQLVKQDIGWCLQRLPEKIRNLLRDNPGKLILAGGYIRSCIANEPVNDIDLFVPNKDMAFRIAKTIQEKIYVTDNAYTVRTDHMPTVQVIHRWLFETPEKIVDSFDFTIARATIWFADGKYHSLIDDRFYPDLAAKRLVYCSPTREEEAGGSLLRVLKFYQRGYRIPLNSLGAVIARLAMAVKTKKIDVNNEEAWSRVLTGLLYEVDPNTDFDKLASYIEDTDDVQS